MKFDNYYDQLTKHYSKWLGNDPLPLDLPIRGDTKPLFSILKYKSDKLSTYVTVGMSLQNDQVPQIEVFFVTDSPDEHEILIGLQSVCLYHQEVGLNLHHTINLGVPWARGSLCEYGLLSLPYIYGPKFETFHFEKGVVRCLWLVPITDAERSYKRSFGIDALEGLFEAQNVEYHNLNRASIVG